ncbi:MAG: hypothetical protein M3Z33_08875, partial [Actinomycetota bacterium]|nr:hypothetical protein [Actinomycetota bacterium]
LMTLPVLRVLVIVALLAAPISGCGGSKSSYPIVGVWSGQLTQQGLAPFRVTAQIRGIAGTARNTVAYTGISCNGHWVYRGRPRKAFRFREVIDTSHSARCKGVGLVTLTPHGQKQLIYLFHGGGVISRGTLTRR